MSWHLLCSITLMADGMGCPPIYRKHLDLKRLYWCHLSHTRSPGNGNLGVQPWEQDSNSFESMVGKEKVVQSSHQEESPARIAEVSIGLNFHSEYIDVVYRSHGSRHTSKWWTLQLTECTDGSSWHLGQLQMEAFESTWPEWFYNPISTTDVITFVMKQKHVKIDDSIVLGHAGSHLCKDHWDVG